MLPLALANEGENLEVKKVTGKPEIKKHLENLGFVQGAIIRVVNQINGNMIVIVKETRLAISKEMAQRIMV